MIIPRLPTLNLLTLLTLLMTPSPTLADPIPGWAYSDQDTEYNVLVTRFHSPNCAWPPIDAHELHNPHCKTFTKPFQSFMVQYQEKPLAGYGDPGPDRYGEDCWLEVFSGPGCGGGGPWFTKPKSLGKLLGKGGCVEMGDWGMVRPEAYSVRVRCTFDGKD